MTERKAMPCKVEDLDRAGNRCIIHGWAVKADCWESEKTQVPAPPREEKPGPYDFAMAP
jgi:hypothetical protein